MFEFEIFNIHRLEDREKYYPLISKWWKDWNWPIIDYAFLSTTGAIVKYKKEYICAGWLYQTNSLLCMLDNVISVRKKFTGKIRRDSIKFLAVQLEELGKKSGHTIVHASSKHPNIIKVLMELGYGDEMESKEGSKNMTTFIKSIK